MIKQLKRIGLYAFLIAIIVVLSGCNGDSKTSVQTNLLESQINSFSMEVVVDGEGSYVAKLYNQDNEYIKGFEQSLIQGSNVVSFFNLPNQEEFDLVVSKHTEEVYRTTIEVGTILFTGVQFNGVQKTGFVVNDDLVKTLNYSVGLSRENVDSGEIVSLTFDNPNDYPIKEVMIAGETYTASEFETGSTNELIHIRVYPQETYGYQIQRINNYTISYDDEDIVINPKHHQTYELVTIKEVPEIKSIEAVVPFAHREGEATIAIYLDHNEEEVEFNAITVNGVRYDEYDEEYSDKNVYMFKVGITQKSGIETLVVEEVEYNDLSGQKVADINDLTTSFEIKVDDIGKGTLTSPIRIKSIDDLFYMGQSPVWSRENVTYELQKDLDFNNIDHYNDQSLYQIFSRNGSKATGWEPFGWSEHYNDLKQFNAILDGNNKTISNLYIYKPGSINIAFISYLGEYGTIQDLYFEDAYITGAGVSVVTMHVLGNVDKVAVVNSNEETKEINKSIVHVAGYDETIYYEGSGLVGYLDNDFVLVDRCDDDPLTTYVNECLVGVQGTVTNSYSEATVVSLNNSPVENSIGGFEPAALSLKWELVGLPADHFGSDENETYTIESVKLGGLAIYNGGGEISKSYTDSLVYADVLSRATLGGVIAENYYITKEVYSVGDVTGYARFSLRVGGIAGHNGALILDTYSSAKIYAKTELLYDDNNDVIPHIVSVGGLVGYNAGGNNGVIKAISINQDIRVDSPKLGRSLNYDFVAANNLIYGTVVLPYYNAGKNQQQYYINTVLTVNEFVDDFGNDIDVTPKAPIVTSVFNLMNKDWYLWEGNTRQVITSYAKLVQRRVDWEESSWDFTVIEDGYMPVFKTVLDSENQPLTEIDANSYKLDQLGALAVFSNQELNYVDEDKTLGSIQFDFDVITSESTTEVSNIEIHLHYIDIDAGRIEEAVLDDELNPIIISSIDVTNGKITITPDFNLVPTQEDGTPIKYAFVVYADVDGVRTEIGVKNWIEFYGVEFED